jgi:aryl-alcohol dehydrogenase-like predicted oxidoreductase
MQFRQLGNTGVFVSRLCMGAMTFGGGVGLYEAIGGTNQAETDELVAYALGAGINFFDTANVYSEGASEVQLGKALGSRRKEVVIATKVLGRMGTGANDVGLSRLHVVEQAEASLKRLGTDYIDLYQIHGVDALTPIQETLRALDHLVQQGKVRYIGCSNLAAWQIMKAGAISDQLNLERFITVQAYYSLAGRELEREIVPMLIDQKMGLLPWSPLAGGLLTRKFIPGGIPEKGARRNTFDFPPVDKEKVRAIVGVLGRVAARHSGTIPQVALAWLLNQPHVTSVIIGAKKMSQLKDNVGSIDIQLDTVDLQELDSVSALKPEYPQWMFELQSSGRHPGTVRDFSKVMRSS